MSMYLCQQTATCSTILEEPEDMDQLDDQRSVKLMSAPCTRGTMRNDDDVIDQPVRPHRESSGKSPDTADPPKHDSTTNLSVWRRFPVVSFMLLVAVLAALGIGFGLFFLTSRGSKNEGAVCRLECVNSRLTTVNCPLDAYEDLASLFNSDLQTDSCDPMNRAIWLISKEKKELESQHIEMDLTMSLRDRVVLSALLLASSEEFPSLQHNACMWYGVICDARGNIMVLEINDAAMNGTLPPEVGLLQGLRNLDLSRNHLTGSIPSQLVQLSKLKVISLSYNRLTGSIPPELSLLSELRSIQLEYNALTGANLPTELPDLRYFNLQSNQLTQSISLPHESLEVINLSDNNLTSVDIASNMLHTLHLDHNVHLQYMKGPYFIASLQALHLRGSPVLNIGTILQRTFGLIKLDLSHTRLTSLPDFYSQKLQHFNLSNNEIGGTLPALLDHFYMTTLDLSSNRFTGTIPLHWSTLTNLQFVGLESNSGLSGLVPFALCEVVQLDECSTEFPLSNHTLCIADSCE